MRHSLFKLLETAIADRILLPPIPVEMPPFLRVNGEAVGFHRTAQHFAQPTLLVAATDIVGIGPARHLVVAAGGDHRRARRQIDHGEVDRSAAIVARPLAGIGNEDAAGRRGRIPEHLGDVPGAIGVMDQQAEALRRQRPVDPRQRLRRRTLKERARPLIDLLAEEVVGSGIADVEPDRRIERADRDQFGFDLRLGLDRRSRAARAFAYRGDPSGRHHLADRRLPLRAEIAAGKADRAELGGDDLARRIALKGQRLERVEAAILGKGIVIGTDAGERKPVDPLDADIGFAVALIDAQHIIVPAIVADQSGELGIGRRRAAPLRAGEAAPIQLDPARVGRDRDAFAPQLRVVEHIAVADAAQFARQFGRVEHQPPVEHAQIEAVATILEAAAQPDRFIPADRGAALPPGQRPALTRGEPAAQRVRADPLRRIAGIDRREDDHADPGIGHQLQAGDMAIDRAAMADGALAIERAQAKAEPEAARPGLAILLTPHFGEGRGLQHRAAAIEHRAGESAEIGGVGVEAARCRGAEFERRRGPAPAVEAVHLRPGHRPLQRAAFERARRHAERAQHEIGDRLCIGLARNARDDFADHGDAGVGIFGDGARRGDQPGRIEAGDGVSLPPMYSALI
eukprot:Opistho-1_new@89877